MIIDEETVDDATEVEEVVTEEVKEDAAEQEVKEPEGDEAEKTEETQEAAEPDEGEAEEKKIKTQKRAGRIERLTSRARDAESKASQAQAQVERLQRRLADQDTSVPQEANFDTYEEYTAALAVSQFAKLQQAEREADATDAKEVATAASQEAEQVRNQVYLARAAVFKETAPDFDEVVRNPDLDISAEVARQVADSDKGPEVVYYLGQNPEEASRISQIGNPYEVARELGRIEGRITAPKPRNVTQAPAPVKAVATGSGSQSDFNPTTASVNDIAAELRRAKVIS